MGNEILERKKFIDSIKALGEELGMRGDNFTANSMFHIADFCENINSKISELEIRERVDRDFMQRHLVEYEKLRVCIINIKSKIRDLNLDKDPEILKFFNDAGIHL